MTRPLTVGLPVLYADSASGLGTYTRELLRALAARRDGHRYVVYAPHGIERVADLEWRRVSVRLPLRSPRLRFFLWEQLAVPARVRSRRPDVVHWLHPGPPLCPGRTRTIVTVCDGTPWRDARYAEDRRMAAYAEAYRLAIKRAHQVITISDHARQEIAETLGLAPSDIVRTYLAGPRRPTQAPGPPTSASSPYLLFIGGSEVRKNPLLALEAFVQARLPEETRLVMAGPVHTPGPVHADVRGAIRRLPAPLQSRVVLTGEVEDPELVSLYAHAVAVLYPTEQEGFGLPVLEAMAFGVPVIAARASAVPEVAGDAAILVEPGDQSALTEAIERVGADPQLRAALRERGRARVEAFTWDATAEQTVAVYESVAASREPALR